MKLFRVVPVNPEFDPSEPLQRDSTEMKRFLRTLRRSDHLKGGRYKLERVKRVGNGNGDSCQGTVRRPTHAMAAACR